MEDRVKRAVPVDVGIVTIKDEELRAVLDVFPRSEGVFVGRSGRHYNLRIADAGGGRTYRLAIVRLVEQGNGEAQAAVRDLIDDAKPALVLIVGIAGGVPGSDLTLGDVVISTRINDYTVHQASQGGEREFAIGGGPVAFRVAAGVANLAARDDALRNWTDELPPRPPLEPDDAAVGGPADWQERVRASLIHHFRTQPRNAPRFLDGALGSSDGLIKDVDLLVGWLATARNLRAIEMESAGVYRATRDRCAMLAIRGISDLVGLKRDERWTHYACATAAAFTRAYLATTPVPPGAGSDHHNEMGIANAAMSDEKLDHLTDKEVEADVLTSSRRRCCICTAIRGDWGEKHGRIARLDQNRDFNDLDNLVYLCLEHHDQYDPRTSQLKEFTLTEAKRYRADLISSLRPSVVLPVESYASGGAGPTPLSLAPEWVGVLHCTTFLYPPMQELLLFDRVAVINFENTLQLHRLSMYGEPEIADHLEKLEQSGLLFRTNLATSEYIDNLADPALRMEGHFAVIAALSLRTREADENTIHGAAAKIFAKILRDGRDIIETSNFVTSFLSRITAEYLRSTTPMEAISAHPVFTPSPDTRAGYLARFLRERMAEEGLENNPRPSVVFTDVVNVVVNAFPQLDAGTSIDELIRFKTDPEAKHHLLGLRLWLRETARMALPPKETAEKLEWLLYEYEQHLARHGLRWQKGVLESIITTTPDATQTLNSRILSGNTGAPFSSRTRRLSLLESEARVPGREIAYVARARSLTDSD